MPFLCHRAFQSLTESHCDCRCTKKCLLFENITQAPGNSHFSRLLLELSGNNCLFQQSLRLPSPDQLKTPQSLGWVILEYHGDNELAWGCIFCRNHALCLMLCFLSLSQLLIHVLTLCFITQPLSFPRSILKGNLARSFLVVHTDSSK